MRVALVIILLAAVAIGIYFLVKRLQRSLLIYAISVVCVVAVGGIVLWICNLYLTEDLIEGYADNVASAFGVSPLLAKAATFGLLLPVGMALGSVFSPSKRKRRWGRSILAGAAVFYFLALWVGTREHLVSRKGDALQCYVVTDHGVVWRDIRYLGTDPETGRPCEVAKPYLLPTLAQLDQLLRSGRPLEPVDPRGRFFTAIGDPMIWFFRRKDGELEFYDTPGFRPRSGDKLQPITPAVVEEWEGRQAEKAEAERKKSAAIREARLETEAAAKRRQEEEHLAHMRNLVLASAVANVDQTVGLAIVPSRSDSPLDRLAAERLPEVLTRTTPDTIHLISPMFADGFVREGYFGRAFAGDPTPLIESEALTRARRVALGQTETACNSDGPVQGVTTCRITLQLKVFGEDGKVIDAKRPSEIGPGFSQQDAVIRGVELLIERSGSAILESIREQK
jgi:hypothetical protein